MQVRNEELRTTREVAREINSILDAISNEDVEKIIVTDRAGKMRAVIITVESYETFTDSILDLPEEIR